MRAVAGSDWATLESAASVNCRVWNMSTSQLKNRLISAEPRLVVLRTVTRPGTLLTASSIRLVMVTCICSTGITPLSTPITTRGKLVSGKTEIGTWNAAYIPASVNKNRKKKMVFAAPASQKDLSSVAFAGESGISPCLR